MNQIKTVNIHCFSRTLSPITHNAKTSGNETIINREAVYFNDTIKQVPVLSGNAIRHKMIREPGAMYLIKNVGLYGKANIDQLNFLFNGGSLTQSSTTDNMKKIAKMQELIPLVRLLGGSLSNQIIGGSLIVKRGVMICEENRAVIQSQIPSNFLLPEEQLQSCEEFISGYQYTRGDARKHKEFNSMEGAVKGFYQQEDVVEGKSNLMIYNGQTVVAGAYFYHGFVLQNVSRLEVGALLHALNIWDNDGATIGGSSRIGHGQLQMNLYVEPIEDWYSSEADIGGMVTEYIEHVETTKDEVFNWLYEVFP